MKIEPAAFKIDDARKYLGGISRVTMLRLVRHGILKPNGFLRHWLFTREDLDRFLKEGKKQKRKTYPQNYHRTKPYKYEKR
jgi:hypothetical protein